MEDIDIPGLKYPAKSICIPKDIVIKESSNDILRGLLLSKVGVYEKAVGNRVTGRKIDEYIVLFCSRGRGWVEMNRRKWPVSEGDVFFCFKDVIHSYGADSQEPWTIYWSHFVGESIPAYCAHLEVSSDSPLIHAGEGQKIRSLFIEMIKALEKGYSIYQLVLSAACMQHLLGYLVNARLSTGNQALKELDIDKTMCFMIENIGGIFRVKDFSDYVNMSVFHFTRKFKQKTGYSPADYFIRLKMQKAGELLDTTDLRINEIGRILGYENQYLFSAVFKRIFGYSPKEYRKLHKG